MLETDPTRVLAVDDDPMALALLSKHLEDAGYRVVTARNGTEALRIMLEDGPPIVITDWMMPEMDGLDLCRAIRGHEAIPFAYVIIVSAHETTEDAIVEAFDAGVDDYLTKPLKKRELLARLRGGRRIFTLQQELQRRTTEVHRANAEMAIANEKLGEANEQLNRLATTDELTGLFNRREAMARLKDLWSAVERRGAPLSCILMDIDRFKIFNDTHGHGVGDIVLKETAAAMSATTRSHEWVCRIGGEEFLVVCPDSARDQAVVAAERLRKAVEAHTVRTDDLELGVTISAGVAERTPAMTRPDDLLRAADDALYDAKRRGRNRVCLAGKNKLAEATDTPPESAPLLHH